MRTVAFCEIDSYCQRVLRKHWPDVPVWGDVRELTAEALADALGGKLWQQSGRRNGTCGANPIQPRDDGETWIDVICGGFPCQDISVAGKRAGIAGKRSGLWSEYARIIGEVRPRRQLTDGDWWLSEPDVGRVVHGVPARVDRLRALGNAIVPQIAEVIGRAIIDAERTRDREVGDPAAAADGGIGGEVVMAVGWGTVGDEGEV